MRCPRLVRFTLATMCLWGATVACRDRERSQPPTQVTTLPVTSASPTEANLGEGLSIHRWQVTPDVVAYVARLDPKAWELVSVPARQLGAKGGSTNGRALNDAPGATPVNTARNIAAWGDGEPRAPVATLATLVGATLAVNGGYFDENGRVLGLRATRAHRFSTLRQADWGVFSITDSKPLVQHTRDAGNVVDGFAVQCGPRLIVDGKPLTFKPGAHHRTAIGYDGNDWVSLLVTIHPIELEALAAALAKSSDQGGLGLIAALNLDGGPSTAMYVGGVHAADWSVPSPTPVADAVAVVPRGAALPWETHDSNTH